MKNARPEYQTLCYEQNSQEGQRARQIANDETIEASPSSGSQDRDHLPSRRVDGEGGHVTQRDVLGPYSRTKGLCRRGP